jgi:hypothetical protein
MKEGRDGHPSLVSAPCVRRADDGPDFDLPGSRGAVSIELGRVPV